ncbi:DUF481 domain-containing protein [Thalassotalea sp. PS06]|uniref:DUF481 domain-containing protein n=1 Tax=Thalassotalea sp. PS06 TaxID=2594005 RepID=UPI001164B909|nr:DUF481 domain-containing protein [Thalassotalea sp. PS06]QDP02206.1 DUF481 domain-containing protein [Thalassotalea sp. PS06]
MPFALAQWEEPDEWPINRPTMPIRFDWVLLENGELLGGDLLSMYRDKVRFDSDELGLVELDFEDIRQIRSNDIMSIRLENNQIYEGQLLIDRTKVTFFNKPHLSFPRNELLSISPSRDSEDSIWSGNFGLGINFKTGNSERLDYTISLNIERLTALDRISLNYLGLLARSEDFETGETVQTEENQRVTFAYDWFYSRKIFFRIPDIEYQEDKFKNIDLKTTLSLAAGLVILDHDDYFWRAYIGPSIQYTRFVEVEAGNPDSNTSGGLLIGTDLGYDFTEDITISAQYVGRSTSNESGRLIHHIETSLDIELIDDLDFQLKTIFDFIADPIPNELGEVPEKTDILLIFGVKYSF